MADDFNPWANTPLNEAMPFGAGATPQGDPTLLSGMLSGVMNIPKNLIDASKGFDPNDIHGSTRSVVPAATETAMALAGTGAPAAEAGAAGIFGGRLAHTADLKKLFKAEDMADAGKGMNEIINETGWFKPPTDNKWRFEIPDNKASINPNGIDYSKEGSFVMGPAQAMVNHPSLFAAYPALKDSILYNTVFQKPNNGIGRGAFTPRQDMFEIEAPDLKRAKLVGLHELQHGVQNIEGFSPGGSPVDMAWLKQWAPDQLPAHELINDPHHIYDRLAGEVEARNAMVRSWHSPMTQGLPWKTQDTPYMNQLALDPITGMVRALRNFGGSW